MVLITRNTTTTIASVLLLFFLAWTASSQKPEKYTVTFRLHSPDLAEEAEVYITGGIAELGNWRPANVRMTYAGDHLWTFELTVERKQTIDYKYTLGSWAREGASTDGKPLKNLTVTIDKSQIKNDRIDHWTSGQDNSFTGQITGTVRYHRQLVADGLRPRDVIVWLPPDYETSTDVRYPVLYMHDGQNIVDPKTSSFGVDWQVDETCTNLIEKNEIRPMIVVGIYNTRDRDKEYRPGDKGKAYQTFIVETLKPLIDQGYRTRPERADTWVAGASSGGLSAFMMVWERSDIFSTAICMAPDFKFENSKGAIVVDYVSRVTETAMPESPVKIYIDNGGDTLDKMLQPGIDGMLQVLAEKGMQQGGNLHWVLASEDRHNEIAWAKRLPQALKLLTSRQ